MSYRRPSRRFGSPSLLALDFNRCATDCATSHPSHEANGRSFAVDPYPLLLSQAPPQARASLPSSPVLSQPQVLHPTWGEINGLVTDMSPRDDRSS